MNQQTIRGRIDEQGKVLLPVIVFASDGLEVEIEATVSLQYGGALAIDEELAKRLGWRKLGARRVVIGFQTIIMDHCLGTISLSGEANQTIVLSGIPSGALIGAKFLAGRKLTLDFTSSQVTLE